MRTISDFNKFVEDTNKALMKGLENFFSEEIEIFGGISDMTREWEDEGVVFSYRLLVKFLFDEESAELLNLDDEEGDYDIETNRYDIDLIDAFSDTSLKDIPTLLRREKKIILKILIGNYKIIDSKIVINCINSLYDRIKSAYPLANVSINKVDRGSRDVITIEL